MGLYYRQCYTNISYLNRRVEISVSLLMQIQNYPGEMGVGPWGRKNFPQGVFSLAPEGKQDDHKISLRYEIQDRSEDIDSALALHIVENHSFSSV